MRYFLELADDRIKYVGEILSQRGEEIYDIEAPSSREGSIVILSPAHKLSIQEAGKYGGAKTIFGGKQTDEVASLFSLGQYINVLLDETFAMINSSLTAENFLVPLISSTSFSLYDERILITGSGRLAHALWQLMNRLDIPFSVTMRDKKALSSAKSFVKESFLLSELENRAKEFSVIINTIPDKIFENVKFSDNCILFELSSVKSIGENIGVKYITCPALPGKYSPKSAGKALLEMVDRHIKTT